MPTRAGVPRWGRRVPVSRCDRESRIPGSSRIIPAYPGLKLLIDLTVRAPAGPVFPARCPNCDVDWYLQTGRVTALRRLCDELRSVQRDAERAYHVRLVFERPMAEGDRDDG